MALIKKNNRSSIPLIFMLLVITSCQSEKSSQHWEGMTSQDDNFGISYSYYTTLDFDQTGDQLSGIGYYLSALDSSKFVYYTFTGYWKNDTLYAQENGIQQASDIAGEWVMKDLKFHYTDQDHTQMRGYWSSQKFKHINGVMKLSLVP